MLVRDIMTLSPLVVKVTEKLRDARRKLLEADIRHLPVMDGRRVVGVISDRDLPAALVEPSSPAGGERGDQPVARVMSSDVVSVYPDADVAEAIDLMLEHKVGALPVIDPSSQELVGIISYVDVLRSARDTL